MVLMQILCFLFEFLLVHWYFQPRYHLVGAVPASCHPRWGMVHGGLWWMGYWKFEGKKQGHGKKVGVLNFEL